MLCREARTRLAIAFLVATLAVPPLASATTRPTETSAAAPHTHAALVHIRRQVHLSGLLRPTIPVAAAAVSARTVQLSDAEQLENAIVGQLNAVRHAHGLRSLERSAALSRAADDHVRALALAGQFRHEWPDGRPFKVWIRAYYSVARTHFWSVGENLLWTSGELDALQAANMWLPSPPHRRILLMRSWRQIGIGVVRAQGAGGVYAGADIYIAAADFVSGA
jgi:uncharacterized protein YkwD